MSKLAFLAFVGAAFALAACNTSTVIASSGCSDGTSCANNAGSMQTCYSLDPSGGCTALYYQVGETVFPCVSCDDQGYCANAALIACGVPDASIPLDADFPEGATRVQDSGQGDK